MEEQDRLQKTMLILHTRTACRIHMATNTRSEYTVGIAFPMQQRLHERASQLRHTYAYLS